MEAAAAGARVGVGCTSVTGTDRPAATCCSARIAPCPRVPVVSPPVPSAPLPWGERPGDLPRQFASRDALERELKQLFPQAEGGLSPIEGGRRRADELLTRIQPQRYGKGRNFLDGPVTRLSPYIRHGVLTLAEVRDAVFRRTRQRHRQRPQVAVLTQTYRTGCTCRHETRSCT